MGKTVQLFTPGLDSFLVDWMLNKEGVEHQKVYFFLNSRYTKNEIMFMQKHQLGAEIDFTLNIQGMEQEDAYVPNRNLLMMSVAAGKYGADTIILGGMKDDRVSDQGKEFYDKAAETISLSLGREVKIMSPYFEVEKADAVGTYYRPGSNSLDLLLKTYSCFDSVMIGNNDIFIETDLKKDSKYQFKKVETYYGCRKCKACFRKFCALAAAGIYVPFENEEIIEEYQDEKSVDKSLHPGRYMTVHRYLEFLKTIKI